MKIQNLAVMFIIIILPISLVLGSYTATRIRTLNIQTSYDSGLYDATYDAIKAFQLNTVNSSSSHLVNSKIRDIKASVNTFFNSVAMNFKSKGYDKESLENYVPALVYTLYDGYYIYSPYTNTWDDETKKITDNYKAGGKDTTYEDGEELKDLKPYVYYSCRYKRGTQFDIVITYSLDSYITVNGTIGSNVVNESGYLLSGVTKNGTSYNYLGYDIANSEVVKMNAMVDGSSNVDKCYTKKINGQRYYLSESQGTSGTVYTIFNGKKLDQTDKNPSDIINNTGAKEYYEDAFEFKQKFLTGGILNSLLDLRASDAVDENGNSLQNVFGTNKIFNELVSGTTNIEADDSLFNSHRLDVIKYSIEKNLSVAIANFNSQASWNFQMPKLKDYEWDKVLNNVSMISFLQGLNIGGKVYNGYAIVTNNSNEEFVADDSIYILTNDGVYHRIKDEDLLTANLSNAKAYIKTDFERGTAINSTGTYSYFFPVEDVTGCYQSIVNQSGIKTDKNIAGWLSENSGKSNVSLLGAIYYTALGRERNGMYRVIEMN